MSESDIERVKVALNLLRTTVTLGLLDLEQRRGHDVSAEVERLEHRQGNDLQKLIFLAND